MAIKIKVAKGIGECLGNFVRQVGIAYSESFRVVGFTLHDNNSVNLYKVENAFQLGSMLHDMDFMFREQPTGDFYSVDYSFQNELCFADLSNGIVDVKYKNTPYLRSKQNKESVPILSSPSSKDSRLTLYFRKSRGVHSLGENKQFLELKLPGMANTIVPLSSNHSDLVTCSYSIEEREGDFDVLSMRLEGIDENESQLFQKIVDYGISLLNSTTIP